MCDVSIHSCYEQGTCWDLPAMRAHRNNGKSNLITNQKRLDKGERNKWVSSIGTKAMSLDKEHDTGIQASQ